MTAANPSQTPTFRQGMQASASIMVGYAPMAFSFGVVAVQAGLSPWQALLVSVIVFAGAAQFILVSLLASGAGFGTALSAVLLLNVRHLFYGPALVAQLTNAPKRWAPWLAWGLTDEVFATAMSAASRGPLPPAWCTGLGLGAYSAWVGGTAAGAWLGAGIGDSGGWLASSLDFVLPALFIALLAQAFQRTLWPVVAVAMISALLALLWVPVHVAMVIGMLSGALVRPWLRQGGQAR
ncbi:MAG: AzlC family ABC transporter permease [Saccharospirillum sp.]